MLPAYAGMIPIRSSSPLLSCGAPRVCGDDPIAFAVEAHEVDVLPAYAGMIRPSEVGRAVLFPCSPRMRG